MNETPSDLGANFNWIIPISFAALAFSAGVLIQHPSGRELISRLPKLADALLAA
ncbi:hypothetical protein ACFXQA_11350 [Microbacterium sp. P07]|uniref:hypothetical protein n=1 Tax=Microbacterium sp. P07 TaxID=3366952 RepID=UPI003745B001